MEKEFFELISKYCVGKYVGVEDFADKLSFIGSVVILLVCTAIVTMKQYLLKPIVCYISTSPGGTAILAYVENYCWVQGTLPISFYDHREFPSNNSQWEQMNKEKILYYQWVPFVLGLQCCLFYIPRLIWQAICYNQTGIDLEGIINKALEAIHAADCASRSNLIENIATSFQQLIFQQHRRTNVKSNCSLDRKHITRSSSATITKYPDISVDTSDYSSSINRYGCCQSNMQRFRGCFIINVYLLTKLLYLGNALGQLFLMTEFLGFGRDSYFGLQVLNKIWNGLDWQMTQIFPRVAFCYVPISALGSTGNAVTAQCALPTNMLNEKIYIFLWWWISLVAAVTIYSIFLWLLRFYHQANYIIKYIQLASDVVPYDERDAYDFATKFLRRDGMFLMRMVRLNAGDVVAAEVVNCLWLRYLQRRQAKTHCPMSNYPLRATGWLANLEQGSRENIKLKTVEEKEYLYPQTMNSLEPMKTQTFI